jgi:hypothetical protein
LLPRQSLARLQHLLTVNRWLASPYHRFVARSQPSVQHLCPSAAVVTGSAAPLCVTGVQLCTQRFSKHLQPPADVSRFHTTRQVASRSTANASGETDSVAAVKRLVSLHVTQYQLRPGLGVAQGHLFHTSETTARCMLRLLHKMVWFAFCWPECTVLSSIYNLAASACSTLRINLFALLSCSMMQQSSVCARLCS